MTEEEMREKLAELKQLEARVAAQAEEMSREAAEIRTVLEKIEDPLRAALAQAEAIGRVRGHSVGSERLVLETLLSYGDVLKRIVNLIEGPEDSDDANVRQMRG